MPLPTPFPISDGFHLARVARTLLVGAVAILSACSTRPKSPELAVQERAQAYLEARVAREFNKAYGYLSPGTRAVLTFDAWRGNLPQAVVWKSAKVASVRCQAQDRCTVTNSVSYQTLALGQGLITIPTAYDDTWLASNGEWWLLDQQ